MMDLESLLRGASSAPGVDIPMVDAAETIQISSLALIKVCIFSLSFKMLKHGRAGVPMEVMGLMLGDFVDDYTIRVVDVFAMPQSGTGVSVEAVDPVFQMKMLDMLKQTGRPEMVVGWYHSHPGFGCWLSGVDIGTQQVCTHFGSYCCRALSLLTSGQWPLLLTRYNLSKERWSLTLFD